MTRLLLLCLFATTICIAEDKRTLIANDKPVWDAREKQILTMIQSLVARK